jgi:hypothetical protein
MLKGGWKQNLGKALNSGREVGSMIENVARTGMWLDGLAKGLDNKQSAQRVFKYLFNYDELSDFEKNYLRRVIPFYTYTRKAAPMLVEAALTNPGKVATMEKAFRAVETWSGVQEDEIKNLPDWMKKFGTVKLPWKDNKGNNLWASIDLPAATLEKVAGLDLPGLFSGKTPLIDLWLVSNNVKTFPTLGAAVEKFPGEMTKAPFWIAWVPQEILQRFGVQPIRDKQSRKMVLGWSKKTQEFVYTALPALKEFSNLVPGGGVDVEEEDAVWRGASYATGINLRPVDEREQMFYKRLKAKGLQANFMKKVAQLGRRPTPEEIDEYRKQILELR